MVRGMRSTACIPAQEVKSGSDYESLRTLSTASHFLGVSFIGATADAPAIASPQGSRGVQAKGAGIATRQMRDHLAALAAVSGRTV